MNALDAVSVVLLAKDSSQDLKELAPFLLQFGAVVVGDDGSGDDTVTVCGRYGFEVLDVSEMLSFRAKRIKVLESVRTDWILIIDTDERPRDDFVEQVSELIAGAPAVAGYEVRRRTFFGSKWLRYGGVYPMWTTRLFRRDCYIGFIGDIHERVALRGSIVKSRLEFDHYSYRDTSHYIAKISKYTDEEARELYESAEVRVLPPLLHVTRVGCAALKAAWSNDPATARNLVKARLKNRFVVVSMLPLYPIGRFLNLYVLRQGYRDGFAGLRYAALSACYSVLKYSKYYDLHDKRSS